MERLQNYKQAISSNSLVCIATKDQLNTKFWKNQNKKRLNMHIRNEKNKKAQIMELMPYFDLTVAEFEIKWRKDRRKFNVIQKSTVSKVFRNRYKEKIIEILGEEAEEQFRL